MYEETVLGIDLGGTKIAAALISPDLKILWEDKVPTDACSGVEGVLSQLLELIKTASAYANPTAIGLGIPGPLDRKTGTVINAPNLGWHHVPIGRLLEEAAGIPVLLENDANAAALGEQVFGAGRGVSDLIFVTVSTGIGGGIIVNNRLVEGRNGGAGEIGHIKVVEDGPVCGCGQRGCLEALASGTAMARTMVERLSQGEESLVRELAAGDLCRVNMVIIGQAAQAGDPLANEVISDAMRYLGTTLANLVSIFNPELIIIGGGVTNIGPLLFQPISREIQRKAFPTFADNLSIVPAALGSRAGVLGAAAVARQYLLDRQE